MRKWFHTPPFWKGGRGGILYDNRGKSPLTPLYKKGGLNGYIVALLCFLLLVLSGNPCDAHKVKMFASAEGEIITGYVYYTTGGKPKNVTVLVQDSVGNPLGEVTTNEEGEFTFTADAKRDYVFVLELSDGHRTSFTVTADELPDSLPSVDTDLCAVPQEKQNSVKEELMTLASQKTTPAKEEIPTSIPFEEIEDIVNKAVSKQIRPLREQLEGYEEKIRLHDILGGLGYIIGLMGLGYFLGARRKRNK
jgi:nickel transport protein